MAEGVFRHLSEGHPAIGTVDSCGTAAFYHAGERPDARTSTVLQINGIMDYEHQARMLQEPDFASFHYVLVMDRHNLRDVRKVQQRMNKEDAKDAPGAAKVMLFGDFGGTPGEEVLDPYYGDMDGFSDAYDQFVRFTRGFLEYVSHRQADDSTL
ncbi:MAG: hypothetical protein M1826_003698 [Phylliscum demangeonii]|nr:MAG: hypothetical protein M1826_003698 [Phylliscum demangeonii]